MGEIEDELEKKSKIRKHQKDWIEKIKLIT